MTYFTEIVSRVARDRVFPAQREAPLALRELVDYITSDQPIDRPTLAALLAGKLNRPEGRPPLTHADHERRDSLIADARALFEKLREGDTPYHDALADAAEWAAEQPRNAEGRKASSLARDIARFKH